MKKECAPTPNTWPSEPLICPPISTFPWTMQKELLIFCPDTFNLIKCIRDPVSKFITINFYRGKNILKKANNECCRLSAFCLGSLDREGWDGCLFDLHRDFMFLIMSITCVATIRAPFFLGTRNDFSQKVTARSLWVGRRTSIAISFNFICAHRFSSSEPWEIVLTR